MKSVNVRVVIALLELQKQISSTLKCTRFDLFEARWFPGLNRWTVVIKADLALKRVYEGDVDGLLGGVDENPPTKLYMIVMDVLPRNRTTPTGWWCTTEITELNTGGSQQ